MSAEERNEEAYCEEQRHPDDPYNARSLADREQAIASERLLLEANRKIRSMISALEKAEEALTMCRNNYENRGDYYDGFATNALKEVRLVLHAILVKPKDCS
jgi:hypothetical protein